MVDWLEFLNDLLPLPLVLIAGGLCLLDRELNDDERRRVGAVLWGHSVERSIPRIIEGTVEWLENRLVGGTLSRSIARSLAFTTVLNTIGFAFGLAVGGGARPDAAGTALMFVTVLACTAVPDVLSIQKTFFCIDRFRNATTVLRKIGWIGVDLVVTATLAVGAAYLVAGASAQLNSAQIVVEKVQPAMLEMRAAFRDLDTIFAADPDLAEAREQLQPGIRELEALPDHAYPEPIEDLLRRPRPPLDVALMPTIITSLALTLIYMLAVVLVLTSGLARVGLKPIAWLRPTSFVEKRPATAFALIVVAYIGIPYAVLRAVLP